MIKLENVLVATDFSEPSHTAMEYGRTLARQFGATLHVVHVVENVFMRTAAGEFGISEVDAVMQNVEDGAQKQLDAFVSDADRRDLRVQCSVCNADSAATGLVAYAREYGSDMIIIGTHGRGTLSKLLTGSVAEQVMRTAPCPVLTVHEPGHEDAASSASPNP